MGRHKKIGSSNIPDNLKKEVLKETFDLELPDLNLLLVEIELTKGGQIGKSLIVTPQLATTLILKNCAILKK